MKKSILLSLFIALASVSATKAQYFVSSCGVVQSFKMPYEVYNVVNHQYHGYDIVHSTQVRGPHSSYFKVVLQRGNIFVQVNIDNRGRINQRMVQNYNPIANHTCHAGCGYHTNYYVHNQHEWNHGNGQAYGYANKNPQYNSKKKGNTNNNQYERIDVNPSSRYNSRDSRDSNENRSNTRVVANNNTSSSQYPTRRN